MRTITTSLLLLLAVASSGSAQSDPDTIKHRNDCRLATQVVETGHPAPHLEWAHRTLHGCGAEAWGRAGAGEIRRLAASSDSAAIVAAWRDVRYVRDADLFDAALSVAENSASSPLARLHAIAGLSRLKHPRYDTWPSDMVGAFDAPGRTQARCAGRASTGIPMAYVGTPLPADWRERVTALGMKLYHDASEPAEIRSAGACLATNLLYG